MKKYGLRKMSEEQDILQNKPEDVTDKQKEEYQQTKEALDKIIEKAESAPPILITEDIKPDSSVGVNVGPYSIHYRWLDDGELLIYTQGATPPLSIILPKIALYTLREFIK